MVVQNPTAPDLTKEPPRSPRERVGGYAILGRTLDKGRASLNGNIGEYHYDCPLDNILFGFAGIEGDPLLEQIKAGHSDDELAEWVSSHGKNTSTEEANDWSDEAEEISLYQDPKMGDFFKEECERLGLDPTEASLFDMLEADDEASFE